MTLHAARLDEKADFTGKWLDESDPMEKAYVKANHGHNLNADPHEYFTISETAENALMQATNEVHLMYLHATEKVLKDDNLLKLFNIPKSSGRDCGSPAEPASRYGDRQTGFLHG